MIAAVLLAAALANPTAVDGDTFKTPRGLCRNRCRLHRADAPEAGWRVRCPAEYEQSILATARLQSLLSGAEIVSQHGRSWGRPVVEVVTKNGQNISDVLMREGWAKEWPAFWCGEREP